jgi:DNA-binding transcriptional LysR family regulator
MDFDDRVVRRLKLSDLRLLHAVVAWGGMAKAAAHLNISQPAVSKAISALERTLGVKLLDRHPQGVEPTIYGKALIDGGVAIFDELKQSVGRIAHLADPGAGELRIGCTESGAAGFVPSVINRLARQYPRIHFHVVTADPDTLAKRELPQRTIELAIGAIPDLRGTDVQSETLFDDRHVVMAGADNKWARRRNINLADLIGEAWILPPAESIQATYIADAFRACGLEPPQSRVTSFSIPLCHHLLATGGYLTMHPIVMRQLASHLALKMLDVRFEGVRRRVGILTLKNRTLSALAQRFIASARQMAKPLARAAERA